MLAQELYAILQDDIPLKHYAPITLYQQAAPALRIRNYNDSIPAIRLERSDGTYLDWTPTASQGTQANVASAIAASSLPPAMPGRVVSGSGLTYQVEIFPNGLSGGSETVAVRQLKDVGTLAADTWTIVCQAGDSNYYMQGVP